MKQIVQFSLELLSTEEIVPQSSPSFTDSIDGALQYKIVSHSRKTIWLQQ